MKVFYAIKAILIDDLPIGSKESRTRYVDYTTSSGIQIFLTSEEWGIRYCKKFRNRETADKLKRACELLQDLFPSYFHSEYAFIFDVEKFDRDNPPKQEEATNTKIRSKK